MVALILEERLMSAKKTRRSWTPDEKAELVLAGLRGDRSVRDVCRDHESPKPSPTSGVTGYWRVARRRCAARTTRARMTLSSNKRGSGSPSWSGRLAARPMIGLCSVGSEVEPRTSVGARPASRSCPSSRLCFPASASRNPSSATLWQLPIFVACDVRGSVRRVADTFWRSQVGTRWPATVASLMVKRLHTTNMAGSGRCRSGAADRGFG